MEWISVKERLPDYATLVIATNGKGVMQSSVDRYGQWEGFSSDLPVTYWMPFPDPPEDRR